MRPAILVATGLLLASIPAAAQVPTVGKALVVSADPVPALLSAISSFTGDDPQECGRLRASLVAGRTTPPSADALAAGLKCASEAVAARRTFWLFSERPATSFAASGLLGTGDGRTWRFSYDTAGCASSGNGCRGQLSLTRCAGPLVRAGIDGFSTWACSSEPAELPPNPDRVSSVALEPQQLFAAEPQHLFAASSKCQPRLSSSDQLSVAWVRRFVARIKRNWFVPTEALQVSGTVLVSFNVRRDGTITEVEVVASLRQALDDAAVRAIRGSSPVEPLPASFPEPFAHFETSFCYM